MLAINQLAEEKGITRSTLITSILINDRDIRDKSIMNNAPEAPEAPAAKPKRLTIAQQEEKREAAQVERLAKMEDDRDEGIAANKAYHGSPEHKRQLKHAERVRKMEVIKTERNHTGRLDTLFDIPDDFFIVIPEDDDFSIPPFLNDTVAAQKLDLENIMADIEDL